MNELVPANTKVARRAATLPTPAHLDMVIPEGEEKLRSQVGVLLALVHSLTYNTTNPDVMALSMYSAQDICDAAGIDPDTTGDFLASFARYYAELRKTNPMSRIFDG